MINIMYDINTIILPVRPQTDTCIAIYLLVRYGGETFNISDLKIEMNPNSPDVSDIELWKQGTIAIDTGKGIFDHHNQSEKTTVAKLVAEYLEITEDQSIIKLLELAERDDFYGKGTISKDPLDRAFGLPGLLTCLNKTYSDNPTHVVQNIIPLLAAHHHEEEQRTKVIPALVEQLKLENKINTFIIKQRKKNLSVIIVETNIPTIAGFLRSKIGGAYDVVLQLQETGHANILTRPTKRIDLRSLTHRIRTMELSNLQIEHKYSDKDLAQYGKIPELQQWYYDTATNTIQNGGVNPDGVSATTISKEQFIEVLNEGLSELTWSPIPKESQSNKINTLRIKSQKNTSKKNDDFSFDLATLIKQARESQ
ncbi:MAG: hypothetical protein ACI870_000120 [Crocinitomicaceae bacterium]|jgi:hypothetical protein